jgi:hypothetical protein
LAKRRTTNKKKRTPDLFSIFQNSATSSQLESPLTKTAVSRIDQKTNRNCNSENEALKTKKRTPDLLP